jgi:translation initiation factor 5B
MRGGSAADLAILVVDTNKGFEPQTIESLEILVNRKVPFVVALNKVDMISGWRKSISPFITEEMKRQGAEILESLDMKIYNVVGSLSRLGYSSEAFWRIKEFTKEVAIVPVSASTGVGIPELLAVLVGLAQQYMSKRLERHNAGGRGIVLEVNEEVGLGPSANIILLDGTLKHGDSIVVARREGSITTKIKALLLPKPLDEMRDPRDKFKPVSEVISAAGLKITSHDLEGVLAGSPLYVLEKGGDEKTLKQMAESEIRSAIVNTDSNGIILRCDAIGSLEAIVSLLRKEKTAIRSADIGHVTRRDIIEASAVKEKDRYLGVVLGFNVKVLEDAHKEAQDRNVKLFNERVIYNLIRNYTDWVKYQREHEESILFNEIPPVCKFRFLKGYVFRRNDPAVFGAEIIVGRLRQKIVVMGEDGRKVGIIQQVQENGKAIDEGIRGMQIAVSVKGPTVGRQINEEDIFLTDLNSRQAKMLIERFSTKLNEEEKEVFQEILALKRRSDPAFGFV